MEDRTALICTVAIVIALLYVSGTFTKTTPPQPQQKSSSQGSSYAPVAVDTSFSDIEIYVSASCHHCVAMKDEVDQLMAICKKNGIKVRLVTPDDPTMESLMRIRGLGYFPAILIAGKEYMGERTATAILEEFNKRATKAT